MGVKSQESEQKKINFAILAPGSIAKKMAATVSQMDEIYMYAVASRDLEKAECFAKQWNFEKAYGSYEEMLKDSNVDLVYVCSPHSLHFEYAKQCLEYGKHVLIEKPITVNVGQVKELIRLSQEKHKLLAEAIWTRYMPSRRMLDAIIESQTIGKITSMTANLGYSLGSVERMQKSELAGGALLDLGVYPIHFALMVMKEEPLHISSDAVLSPEGIDWMNSITLRFRNNRMALLHSNMLAQTNRLGMIFGENGYIEVQNINNCEEIRLFDKDHKMVKHEVVPKQNTGFEYQVEACVRAIRQNEIECEEMPHSEMIRVMQIMDEIRSQWKMKFSCE